MHNMSKKHHIFVLIKFRLVLRVIQIFDFKGANENFWFLVYYFFFNTLYLASYLITMRIKKFNFSPTKIFNYRFLHLLLPNTIPSFRQPFGGCTRISVLYCAETAPPLLSSTRGEGGLRRCLNALLDSGSFLFFPQLWWVILIVGGNLLCYVNFLCERRLGFCLKFFSWVCWLLLFFCLKFLSGIWWCWFLL